MRIWRLHFQKYVLFQPNWSKIIFAGWSIIWPILMRIYTSTILLIWVEKVGIFDNIVNNIFNRFLMIIFLFEIAYKFLRKSRVLINLIFTGDTLMMNKLATNKFDFQYDIFLINYPPTNLVLRLLKVKFKIASRC